MKWLCKLFGHNFNRGSIYWWKDVQVRDLECVRCEKKFYEEIKKMGGKG